MPKHRSLARAGRRQPSPAPGPIAQSVKAPEEIVLKLNASRFMKAFQGLEGGPPLDYTGVVCARFGEFIHVMNFEHDRPTAVVLVDLEGAAEFVTTFTNAVAGPDFAELYTPAATSGYAAVQPDGEIEKSEEAPGAEAGVQPSEAEPS